MDDLKPTPDHLQQSLSQLHHLLVGTPRVDDASKRLLREVLGDIERLLDQAPYRADAAAAASTRTGAGAAPPGGARGRIRGRAPGAIRRAARVHRPAGARRTVARL
jgi:hypothetical protein